MRHDGPAWCRIQVDRCRRGRLHIEFDYRRIQSNPFDWRVSKERVWSLFSRCGLRWSRIITNRRIRVRYRHIQHSGRLWPAKIHDQVWRVHLMEYIWSYSFYVLFWCYVEPGLICLSKELIHGRLDLSVGFVLSSVGIDDWDKTLFLVALNNRDGLVGEGFESLLDGLSRSIKVPIMT